MLALPPPLYQHQRSLIRPLQFRAPRLRAAAMWRCIFRDRLSSASAAGARIANTAIHQHISTTHQRAIRAGHETGQSRVMSGGRADAPTGVRD